MSPRVRWSIFATALIGLALSLAATWVHYRLLTDVSYVSPCDINAAFNCSAAYLSRYGSVAGVPVALGGVLWFGVVALVAGFATSSTTDDVAASYLFALELAAVPVVGFLGYASYARLRTGCPICMGTYACVLAILALTTSTQGLPLGRLPARLGQDLRAVTSRGIVLLLVALLFGGVTLAAVLFPREGTAAAEAAAAPAPAADVQANFAAAWAQQPRVDLGIPLNGAKVLVVKFNDFECSTCRVAETYYRPIVEKFERSQPGAVRVIFKDWPWNTSCNSGTTATIPGHEASCFAAAAARMARARGQYDEMATWLFANQDIAPAAVRGEAVRRLGLRDFDGEYAKTLPDIRRDTDDGMALGISGTPTYFINGVRVPSERLIAPEFFELAIVIELHRTG